MSQEGFTEEQVHYLQGFVAGSGLSEKLRGAPTFAGTLGLSAVRGPVEREAIGPDRARGSALPGAGPASGRREKTVRGGSGRVQCFPLDQWDDIKKHAEEKKFPKGTDVLAFKYNGLFYVAPAQDSYMARSLPRPGSCRRSSSGALPRWPRCTAAAIPTPPTRSQPAGPRNLRSEDAINVLESLHEAGVVNRGSGADNIRNVTGSPTAGIDPQELIDTRPLARAMHHYILNHREMYGLPRKFNIAFDGGGDDQRA